MADKYDIYIQPVAASYVKGYRCYEFGFAAALKVRGPQALVNRWAKTFMTPRGSDPLYPEQGTAFGNLPGSNITRVNDDLQDLVAIAIDDASAQVREQDIQGLYDLDEQLQSATLLTFEQSADGIEVWILIKNMAEESLAVRAAVL
jgi:hypothetical protein